MAVANKIRLDDTAAAAVAVLVKLGVILTVKEENQMISFLQLAHIGFGMSSEATLRRPVAPTSGLQLLLARPITFKMPSVGSWPDGGV